MNQMSTDADEPIKLMLTMEDIKELKGMGGKLTEEDNKFGPVVDERTAEFEKEYPLSREDFFNEYNEAVTNFRLDFGVVCERGQVELVDSLKKGKNKKRVTDEYLSCVELSRQKAAQRAQQD